ncbi:MAG: HisA/HisF-related TIM barrel protein, partial [Bacteroidota bacterium]
IFNELEVDELCFLDIRATSNKKGPDFDILKQICDECFMPLSYGGGISDFDTAARIFELGFEKVILNTAAYHTPELITQLASHFGSQAIIVSIDVKKNLFGKYNVFIGNGKIKTDVNPVDYAKKVCDAGAGELLLTCMDKEGTWEGFDLGITKKIAEAVPVPLIANGGAGSISHIVSVVKEAGASAAALGSMVVYQKKGMGVLVNFPDKTELEAKLS